MPRNRHNALHQFAAGINAASTTGHPAAALPIFHPCQQGWKVYYEGLTDGSVRVDDAYWEITAITTGTVGAGDENSIVLSAKATTDNSGYMIQRDFADIELTSQSKKFYLETSVMFTHSSGTVAANEWFVGWAADAQVTSSGGTAWSGADEIIGFGHLDGDTQVYWVAREDQANQLIGVGADLTTGVYAKLACYFDGANYNIYKNDILVASQAMTKLNADEPMCFQALFKTGEAKTNTLDIQYALLAVEL